jgi:hypothetical protein
MSTSDLNVFHERLPEACKLRGTTPERVARSNGMGARSTAEGWARIHRMSEAEKRYRAMGLP